MTANNINCSSSCPTLLNNLDEAQQTILHGFRPKIGRTYLFIKNGPLTGIVFGPNHHDIVTRNYSIIKPGRVSIFSTRIIRNLCHMRRVLVSSRFLQAFVPEIARAFMRLSSYWLDSLQVSRSDLSHISPVCPTRNIWEDLLIYYDNIYRAT